MEQNLGSGMTLIPFSEIKELAPGASTEQSISVTFINATQPAKFEILYVHSLRFLCSPIPSLFSTNILWLVKPITHFNFKARKRNIKYIIATINWWSCITSRADITRVCWSPKYVVVICMEEIVYRLSIEKLGGMHESRDSISVTESNLSNVVRNVLTTAYLAHIS